jgi:hypothetical protein
VVLAVRFFKWEPSKKGGRKKAAKKAAADSAA